MNGHLSDRELSGYTHQILSDEQRETIDCHLAICLTCRERLMNHEALQRRIHYGLLTDLNAVRPSPMMTYAGITARLNQRRSLVFRQLALRMTVAVTAAALLITLIVLTNKIQQPVTNSTGLALAASQIASFMTLGSTSSPGNGWFLAGTAPQNYATGIDQVVTHDGKSSGYISSTVRSSEGFGTWMQMFKADAYRGKRLRLSAYVKAEHVDDWAGLWMRIDGPDGMISLDNMQNRPIRGTVDWQKVAIVLDVPQNSVGIAFGVLVQGVGRVWIDTVRFEVVGQNVPTTGIKEDTTPISQPSNLGFEAGLRGWSPESASQDYTIDIDPTVAHSGQASGHIQSKVAEPLGAGALSQYVKADNYRGKPLRITTSIKSDGVSAAARFVVYAFDSHNAILRSDSQPISSTAVWQRHDIILNVPDNSAQIAYGIVLEGQGQVWIDDVQIEVVGSQVLPAPLDRTIEQQPANLDFEAGNTGWSAAGSDTQEYVSGIDPTIAYRGQASGSIQSIVSRPDGLGLLRQTVKAGEYRDKRVRISGYLKTDRLNGAASFLMTIYGQQDQMIYSNSRSIDGPTDWQWFWLVLNVPVNSDRIEYGLALRGEGQVWIDDVRVELVGNDIETSSFETSPIQPAFIGPSQPGNLDFESDADLQAWFNSRNPDYEVSVDHRVVHSGSASAHIQSKATVSAGSYEVLSQFIRTDSYRGQRMRLSGYIKTNQVEGWAGMWMNIANSSNQLLVLDNMQNRPITGTIDWRKYEIVLDIPEDGAVIGFGALLQGKGEIWWDDVKLEIVGQDVPTTNPYQERPLNLDFENSK